MYEIKNILDKPRFCEDKLIKPNESILVDDEKYILSARLSPHIFEVKQTKKQKEADK